MLIIKQGAKTVFGILAIATGLASPALADGMSMQDMPWSGPYIGLLGGVGALNPRPTQNIFVQPKDTSFLAGGLAGYNFQIGQWVLGVEGHMAFTNLGKTKPCTTPTWRCNAGADWIGSVRARAGFAVDDQALIFATGGLALMGYEGYTLNTGTSRKYKDSKTFTGWTAGGGFNYRITSHMTVGAEALYARYGRKTMQYDVPYRVKPATFSAFLTLSYQF
jgi:outer membrane immunogenic protein